jgi:DNA-binding MarR family transcriptional regulator
MKNKKFDRQNRLFQLWFIIGIISGFLTILFFSVNYLNSRVICSLDCTLKNQVNIILVLLSLFGIFIGSLTYYFISEKYEKKIDKIQKNFDITLDFLDLDEKKILSELILNKGKITQSNLSKNLDFSRVKISRHLLKLENKSIIKKHPHGMTNIIYLEDKYKKIFVE